MAYYGTDGMKVGSSGGFIGKDWNLNAIGSISRVIRGLPDDFSDESGQREGWLRHGLASQIENYSYESIQCNNENDWQFAEGFKFKDTQPDEFIISALGLGGKFVLVQMANPTLCPFRISKSKHFHRLVKLWLLTDYGM